MRIDYNGVHVTLEDPSYVIMSELDAFVANLVDMPPLEAGKVLGYFNEADQKKIFELCSGAMAWFRSQGREKARNVILVGDGGLFSNKHDTWVIDRICPMQSTWGYFIAMHSTPMRTKHFAEVIEYELEQSSAVDARSDGAAERQSLSKFVRAQLT